MHSTPPKAVIAFTRPLGAVLGWPLTPREHVPGGSAVVAFTRSPGAVLGWPADPPGTDPPGTYKIRPDPPGTPPCSRGGTRGHYIPATDTAALIHGNQSVPCNLVQDFLRSTVNNGRK